MYQQCSLQAGVQFVKAVAITSEIMADKDDFVFNILLKLLCQNGYALFLPLVVV